ncbi:MAG: 16S rRNA (cytosine(1402)-N(4))-methyltransferase RsmH, partial [Oscillospiraceae bacterium]|nr:16S rRNA (cytosine(1402)-N(4))-methyltransferase RsmH [Oscillospiraceae bacterium]
KPIETTLELVDVIRSAMPPAALREKQHPAKRSFQAIRIAVNDELGAVGRVLEVAVPKLNKKGRLAIITFHSLEDRLVKNGMAANARGCTCPPNFPVCICGNKPKVKLISKKPIETTLELVDVIRSAMPPAALREKQHPAKRSFQAIRIAVNDELGAVGRVLEVAVPKLNKKGRLAIITFHSLEDRLVKNGMAANAKGCTCPPNFPVCICGNKPKVKLISKKPIVSGSEELERNPRARSAKLRVCEKL